MPIKLKSSGGGDVTLDVPSTASTYTLTIPAVTATALTDSSGVLNIGSGQVYKDASGNVGVGISNGTSKLEIAGSGANNAGARATYEGTIKINEGGLSSLQATGGLEFKGSVYGSGYGVKLLSTDDGQLLIGQRNNSATWTERARIDSSGVLLIGTTSNLSPSGIAPSGLCIRNSANNGGWESAFISSGASNNRGICINYSGASPNDGFNEAIYFVDSTTARFVVKANGGISNYSANNTNLSDERKKTNIQLAGSYLDKICAIPVKTFLYKDQTDRELNLGVIAQDVEKVAPELVDSDGWLDKAPEGEEPYKSIYQTDLQYALMKCIQELKAELDATKAEVAALKGAV